MLLSELTTLRVGGPCADVVVADSEAALIEAVGDADAARVPVLLLGGGSNLLISDVGFEGRVVLVRSEGWETAGDLVTVAAGESWSGFVTSMVSESRAGVEALSGIPGAVGATPFQNVGAYGAEVADTIRTVRAFDRRLGTEVRLTADQCGFGYRSSIFKSDPQRYLILEVTFELPRRESSAPVRYSELARTIGVDVGAVAAIEEVAGAVLSLRRAKGMVLDDADHDTWSAGSFFTNPVMSAAAAADILPVEAPRYPAPLGAVKTSAAWLIEHAGFSKGYRVRPGAPASLSGKHTLALTNRGGANALDMLELARAVRDGVVAQFQIDLLPEPILVGCSL